MYRLILVVILTAVSWQAAIAQNAPRDRVTYTSFRPGDWDIYLFTQPGQAPERVVTNPGLDYDAVVSPDGRWLVFCSEPFGDPDLFALDLVERGDPRLLIDSNAMEDQASFSPDGESIAFVSTVSGNADIYLLPFNPGKTAAMSKAKNLTRSPAGEFRPAFSPDGQKLAFSSDRDSAVLAVLPIVRLRHGDIYVLDLRTDAVQRLTVAPGWDGSPAWSNDGNTIVFYRGDARTESSWKETRTQIWAMNSDGANQRLLTPGETNALSPIFLTDGRILYSRKGAEGHWQLVSIDGDGHGERLEGGTEKANLWKPVPVGSNGAFVAHGTVPPFLAKPSGARNAGPDLSDGPFLADGGPIRRTLADREIDLYAIRYFSAIVHPTQDLALLIVPPGPSDVLLARLDGTERRKIFEFDQSGGSFSSASWSRDGRWAALTRGKVRQIDGEADIWKMAADGGQLVNLTAGMTGNQSFPSFSGDGKEVVFRGEQDGRFNLFLMNADGQNVRPIVTDAANAIFPVFSPVSRRIAFLSNRDNPNEPLYEVYLLELNSDDSQKALRRITHNTLQEGHVAYSHDGQWLIFSSELGGISDEEPLVQSIIFAPQMYGEMYAYRIADGTLTRLTHNKWEEGIPSWEAAVR